MKAADDRIRADSGESHEEGPGIRDEWLDGLRDFTPLFFPIAAFGTMFGAASIAADQSFANTVWASVALFAGASQFVFLEVYSLGVPAWSVMLAVFAVNFRHFLYSAAVTNRIRAYPFGKKVLALFLLTDLQFAAVEGRYSRFEGKRRITPAYYFAFGLPCYVLWILATMFGALSGRRIKDPALIGLDFVLPIYFLSILMGFRGRRNFLPVVIISSIVAVLVERTIGAPWHISLGALAGIAGAVIASLMRHGAGASQSIEERMGTGERADNE